MSCWALSRLQTDGSGTPSESPTEGEGEMFERFRRSSGGQANPNYGDGAAFQRGDGYAGDGTAADGATTRTAVADRPGAGDGAAVADRPGATRTPPVAATSAGPATVAEARAIQRERYGGADGTAIFFGWLS